MIVLGIDPGLKNTGWGVIEQQGSTLRCLAYGCIVTNAADSDAARLAEIHDGLSAVIERFGPHEAAIEDIFFSNNAKSAFSTGQARGVALLAAAALTVGEYGPGAIKLAVVGSGDADKRQVQYMVRAILGLPRDPEPHHAADALATAICHANHGVRRTAGDRR